MFFHGPTFFYWTAIPVLLYIVERIMRLQRGNDPFVVVKVDWIPPVMAIYFRPVAKVFSAYFFFLYYYYFFNSSSDTINEKEHFEFKEGQYLYLNCPHISPNEWHPFTISSAHDDLNFGPRIHLQSGEEVYEVPRPQTLPENIKWR
jgi:hypothetical protein